MMMQESSHIFMKIGEENMINWHYVEDLEFKENKLYIHFSSGRTLIIEDPHRIRKVKDYSNAIIPDICDDRTRVAMMEHIVKLRNEAAQASGFPVSGKDGIKTDIKE